LAEFGAEAGKGERAEVEAVVVAYLGAVVAADWDRACAYLTSETRAQSSQYGGERCGRGLRAAVDALARSGSEPVLPLGVASLRIERGGRAGGGAGFALFHTSDRGDRWMAVKREGGEWKVLSVVPQPFG
jgi:hypothetical protein